MSVRSAGAKSALNRTISVVRLSAQNADLSWLCGLIRPGTFFTGIHVAHILFAGFIGMICGGGLSATCPAIITQAFEFTSTVDQGSKNILPLFYSWYVIVTSGIALYGYNLALRTLGSPRRDNDQFSPIVFLIPSIIGHGFTFLLLCFWTSFVVRGHLILLNESNATENNPYLSFFAYTVFPLLTVWIVIIYLGYGIFRSISYVQKICEAANENDGNRTMNSSIRYLNRSSADPINFRSSGRRVPFSGLSSPKNRDYTRRPSSPRDSRSVLPLLIK